MESNFFHFSLMLELMAAANGPTNKPVSIFLSNVILRRLRLTSLSLTFRIVVINEKEEEKVMAQTLLRLQKELLSCKECWSHLI